MDDGGEWLTLGETAKRLGVSRAAVYGRIERGTLKTRPRGNRGVEVLWSGGSVTPDRKGNSKGDVTHDVGGDVELVTELRARVKALEAEREALIEAGDHLVDQMGEARERAARVEGELAAVREMSRLEAAALREAMGDLASRLDRATDELRELRRPWWRRWFGDGRVR